MNEITMAILVVIIFWSGHILGYITGGIHRNRRKEELEKRFDRSVQKVIDNEMKDQKRYISESNESRNCPLSQDEIYKLLNALQNKEHDSKRKVGDIIEYDTCKGVITFIDKDDKATILWEYGGFGTVDTSRLRKIGHYDIQSMLDRLSEQEV